MTLTFSHALEGSKFKEELFIPVSSRVSFQNSSV